MVFDTFSDISKALRRLAILSGACIMTVVLGTDSRDPVFCRSCDNLGELALRLVCHQIYSLRMGTVKYAEHVNVNLCAFV